MDACEPRLRRRGLLLNLGEFEEGDIGETEGPEGIRIRLRIIASGLRRSVAAAGRTTSTKSTRHFSPAMRDRTPRLVLTAHGIARSGSGSR